MANLFKSIAAGLRHGVSGYGHGTFGDDVMEDLLPEHQEDFGGVRKEVHELQSKARAGDTKAVFALASEYSTGGWLSADPVKAATWMRKAAELGHAVGQILYGSMCASGNGVPKDEAAAAKWFQAAAEQGSSNAAFVLADMYESGVGVTRDVKQAQGANH